jgi:hypothetical protein
MTEPECLLFKMRWWLGRFFSEQEKQNPDLALMERCLDKAQEAAVCAAPYHHARLSAMVVGASVDANRGGRWNVAARFSLGGPRLSSVG